VLTEAGSLVKPVSGEPRSTEPDEGWLRLEPRQANERYRAGDPNINRNGVLKLGSTSWRLDPGKYVLFGTLEGSAESDSSLPTSVRTWRGKLNIPEVRFEVIHTPTPKEFLMAVTNARINHAGNRKAMWKALGALVVPGMTAQELFIALPPSKHDPVMSIHWFENSWHVKYKVDADYGIYAHGIADRMGIAVLSSYPAVKPSAEMGLPPEPSIEEVVQGFMARQVHLRADSLWRMPPGPPTTYR
jgi:hypothetical protein